MAILMDLTKLQKELSDIVGGSAHNKSLILKQDGIDFKMHKRSMIANDKLIEMNEVLSNYQLKLGMIKAVSDGVLSSDVGLEIRLLEVVPSE